MMVNILKKTILNLLHIFGYTIKPIQKEDSWQKRFSHNEFSMEEKLRKGLVKDGKTPQYTYGIYWAAVQAKRLGFCNMSSIEFGVGGGRGLIDMERIAYEVASETGVNIKVYGFDLKEGLPKPLDYRDLPYVWREGFFKMDEPKLKSRLKGAELILGDVLETVPEFLNSSKIVTPIGFVSFDLDYYCSTKAALQILKSNDYEKYLPRILMSFDSVSTDIKYLCEFVGEPLARREFNEENYDRKISKLDHLKYRYLPASIWHEKMYVCHFFRHPLYCEYIHPQMNRQCCID